LPTLPKSRATCGLSGYNFTSCRSVTSCSYRSRQEHHPIRAGDRVVHCSRPALRRIPLLPQQRRILRARRGRVALPMPCTAARRYATFLCSLGGWPWPGLALLHLSAGRQALDGSSFAFALARRFIAGRPARPSESDRAGGASATDPSVLEKKRKGPSVTDRSRPGLSPPSITVTSGLTTPKPQLHRRPHLRPLAAAKEMPRPSASHHRLP